MRPHGFLFMGFVAAQFSNWLHHQVNTSICYWKQPRAAIIRDTVYLDGGEIWWTPGLDTGELAAPSNQGSFASTLSSPVRVTDEEETGNFQGIVLTYNLTEPFNPSSNITGLLLKRQLVKANGISSSPNAYDGAMLANDNEFFLYGGTMLRNDDLYRQPAADAVLEYQAFKSGVDKPLLREGFREAILDEGVTRYLAFGASASAPSENKAWHFSGLASPSKGPIFSNPSVNGSTRAMNVSETLITLDMSVELSEKWTNATLPSSVKGRSNAEMVWVPVGKQGILVVLGGVVYPEWASVIHQSEDGAASMRESPSFMSLIDIYDVAADRWYKQPTTGGPGTRTRGCAVVAPAADRSSFNIYYYGGFDGIHPLNPFYDDVWVLSLPSFTWTLLNEGTAIHARAGHRCFLPYPDQMMVFGGYAAEPGDLPSCLDKGPVVVFNITSGEWMDSYDPMKHGDYGVHEKVRASIGGSANGGATAMAPVPSGWSSPDLAHVFGEKYDTRKIKKYWPYRTTALAGRVELPAAQEENNGSDHKRVIIPAVLVPLVFLAGLGIIARRCWNRRRRSRAGSSADSEAAMRIRSWVRGQAAGKSSTATSSSAVSPEPDMVSATPLSRDGGVRPSAHHEMADTQLAELADTSPPVELYDTGLTPIDVIQKHTSLGPSNRPRPPSDPSHSSICDNSSFVSQTSGAAYMDSPILGGGSSSPLEGCGRPKAGSDSRRAGALPSMTEESLSPLEAGESPIIPPVAKRSVFRENVGDDGSSR
ncbi:hypothetical protein L249_4374 [Ophiocordyceps polyrhachis-furcata BCC 54312]|uniref:Kelch repeat protein n=1 Tax=Ophiocordyceps polyrhachis-furcata BCC 54312 TaxID=1330021 RepID=A0A367L7F5_9HYPO|nr:hypothetical protein L249_4374 [Ophiocordyceps polyrhachis-furcata BCC 54312]